MADNTPIGAQFGNFRQFMGSSGLSDAVKRGLMAYGMEKSGFTDWLNSLSEKEKPVPPPVNSAPPAAVGPASVPPPGIAPQGAAPAAPLAPTAPAIQSPQRSIGLDILDDKLSSFVNPKAENDMGVDFSNPYRPMLSGNEYQQQPGYGTLKKIATTAFTGGMA